MKKEALFYTNENTKVLCQLCPHECVVKDTELGVCGVRKNEKGIFITTNYGIASALGMDPIEKKPLYHFYPGKEILSLGSLGCNMKCVFCQNNEIAQTTVDDFSFSRKIIPEEIVEKASSLKNNIGIAFTYNEPSVYYEYMFDIAYLAKKENFKTAIISNGFINEKPLERLLPYSDAFNIDLKAFSENFYKKSTKSRLKPVLDRLIQIKKSNKHLEITNLVIPTLNDSKEEFRLMTSWISENLGRETVLHISKYFPRYKLDIEPTPIKTLLSFYNIAKESLNHVYLGNIAIPEGNDTFCPNCSERVISRTGYHINIIGLDEKGNCSNCGENVIINI
jgi:pyruvate formate lyase activating enzyme